MEKTKPILFEGTDDAEKAQPDERFFIDEESMPSNSAEEQKKVFGDDFKRQIKNEERKAKIASIEKRLKHSSNLLFQNFTKVLDFLFNIFSIASIIIGIAYGIKYIAEGNAMMVAVCCLFIFVTIFLNEKIS